jgi:hypothetical protein
MPSNFKSHAARATSNNHSLIDIMGYLGALMTGLQDDSITHLTIDLKLILGHETAHVCWLDVRYKL